MPPICSAGSRLIAVTTIPTPPSHWSNARHSRKPGESRSRPVITVEPVVVMPEVASNTASPKVSPKSPKTKGSAPNKHTEAQATVVKTNA